MSSSTPKVSIVTPSFNQGPYLEQTIRSVLEQSYKNIEYIIIDGKSTDESVDIIRKYESQLSYWVSEPDSGQTEALNKGFNRATGDIVAWLNSDDFYEPGCLERIVSLFNTHNDADLICGNSRVLNQDGSARTVFKTRKPDLYTLLYHATLHEKGFPTFIPHQPSVFMRKKVVDAVGKLNESLHYSMDYDLWLSCMELGFIFQTVDEIFSNYLFHDSSKSNEGWDAFMDEWKKVAYQHILKLPPLKRLLFEAWKIRVTLREKHYRKILDRRHV